MDKKPKCAHCGKELSLSEAKAIGTYFFCDKCFLEEIGLRPKTIAGIVPINDKNN